MKTLFFCLVIFVTLFVQNASGGRNVDKEGAPAKRKDKKNPEESMSHLHKKNYDEEESEESTPDVDRANPTYRRRDSYKEKKKEVKRINQEKVMKLLKKLFEEDVKRKKREDEWSAENSELNIMKKYFHEQMKRKKREAKKSDEKSDQSLEKKDSDTAEKKEAKKSDEKAEKEAENNQRAERSSRLRKRWFMRRRPWTEDNEDHERDEYHPARPPWRGTWHE